MIKKIRDEITERKHLEVRYNQVRRVQKRGGRKKVSVWGQRERMTNKKEILSICSRFLFLHIYAYATFITFGILLFCSLPFNAVFLQMLNYNYIRWVNELVLKAFKYYKVYFSCIQITSKYSFFLCYKYYNISTKIYCMLTFE